MNSAKAFWRQVTYARPGNSWTALVINLTFWLLLYAANLVMVFGMYTANWRAVAGVLVFLLPIFHGFAVVARKRRLRRRY
ncbi:hypothetical protein PUR71_35985 [Streptomyces sp. SP17BM10]|uniref:hypothetical protein n=1 Tax=Streptomyces sp. SP17BM10 TaxID=3002530 RepID=UPI002E764A4F|nr:hypothetical protein [Streptomyces sp. SP17BM10]MEE1788258.1 hypothetical protein [Streptomyces sp. SP17BM10]